MQKWFLSLEGENMMDKKEKTEAAKEECKCCCNKSCDCGCQEGKECTCGCGCGCGCCCKKKVFKVLFLFAIILSSTSLLPACTKRSSSAPEAVKVKIEDTAYPSISDAVKNAKNGDTIRVYDDVLENRNILIDKPLSIVGVKNHNNINPKFYGSFTINAPGENDSVNISGLDIIHKGTAENSTENNTTIGINLVDGGVTIKENKISLDNENKTDDGVAGIILSRKDRKSTRLNSSH